MSERKNEKYYYEMQKLANDLFYYLSMNNNPNEHDYQGNHNLTYILKNLTKDKLYFITSLFLQQIPIGDLKELIKNNFGTASKEIIMPVFNEIENKNSLKNGDLVQITKGIFKGQQGRIQDIDINDNENPIAIPIKEKFMDGWVFVNYDEIEKIE